MITSEVVEVVRLLLAAYPSQRQRFSEDDVKAMVAAYAAGLSDLELEVVKAATTRVLRISKFMPSVAEIREAVGVNAHGARRSGLEAWDEVLRKIGSRSPDIYPTIDFDDPITEALMTAPLLRQIRQSDNPAAERARFVEAYEQAQTRERREAQASRGAVSKALPAPAREAVAQLETLSGDLAQKFGGSR